MKDLTLKILDNLQYFADYHKKNNDIFRYKAYQKVIDNINFLKEDKDFKIEKIDDLNNIKGIGKGIHEKLIEFIKDGKISELEKLKKEQKDDIQKKDSINKLTLVYGIGPKKAKLLYEDYDIHSIQDLEKAVKSNLKSKINPKLNIINKKQIIGLKYYYDLLERIPRNEMDEHAKYINDFVKKWDNLEYQITGSYRRESKDSGDIDILFTSNNKDNEFINLIKELSKTEYIVEILAKGPKKLMGICKLANNNIHRRIDMIYTNKESYPFALLYFTGSDEFNVDLRNKAIEQGYSLNEYRLTKLENEEELNKVFKTEEDIFNFLGYKYIPPVERIKNILDKNIYKL